MVAVSLVLWAVLGWDSTWEMLNPLFDALITNPLGAITQAFDPASRLRADMWFFYGMGDHWSAPVIYGAAYIALSHHFEKVGVVKSRNFFLTTALSLGNIGAFELAWNRLYSLIHGQWWAFTFAPKQVYNLGFFVAFVVIMALGAVILYGYGYRVRMLPVKWLLVAGAAALWLLWVFYPLPVTHITVQTDWGQWTNSNLFPQTYYVVDVTNDGYAAGLPHYVNDDLLHGVNTLCKVFTTAAIMTVCMVAKKRD